MPSIFNQEDNATRIQLAPRFAQLDTTLLVIPSHPFLGRKLSTDEWDTLMWKHLNPHLTQFGV